MSSAKLGFAIHFKLRWVTEDDGMNKQELGKSSTVGLPTEAGNAPPAIA